MNASARAALSAGLLGGAVVAARLDGVPLACAVLAPVCIHAALSRSVRGLIRSSVPILLFAATLLVLEWYGGGASFTLPARTVAVFLLSTAAFRAAPWERAAAGLSPRSRLYRIGLFLLFTRHFTTILAEESRRTLQARSLCVRALWRRGGFSSLAWSVAAVFRRALARAERFYAAQSIGGIAP